MNTKRLFTLSFTIAALFALSFMSANASPEKGIEVSFINVGQGDSALISDYTGYDVLIDGGKSSAGPTVVAYIHKNNIDDIDVMVASHADSDHIGGLIDVLNTVDIPVEQVLYNGYPGDTDTWNNFVQAVTNKGLTLTPAQFPLELNWGETNAYVLNPLPGLSNPDQNDVSVVILLDHSNTEYLFTGDIDTSIENEIIARSIPIAADILKVSHHGSEYATGDYFLSQVLPKEAVISVGDNSYGHPAPETIARLMAIGARIWRTDEDGTVIINSDGTSFTVPGVLVDYPIYLPIILNEKPEPPPQMTPTPTSTGVAIPTSTPTATATPTPTSTSVAIPTSTPTATATPTSTPTEQPAPSGNIDITTIFYDGIKDNESDEYVEIKNIDTKTIQLSGWTLRDIADHVYTFPNFLMTPGQVCRIYTNEYHPEWCGFNYGSGSPIWNNTGDTAYLRDASLTLIDEYSY